ncbi:MAG: hypothetical protein LV479_09020 [Methylacidiphilales bacterium]|nr:hypothetical protein [Candidatus Methylacidiphilales bacterium]
MNLDYFETSFFPFSVPEKDSSFASSVGAQTVYPAGFSLDQALQIYWRAKDYLLVASGNGTLGGLSQSLNVNGLLPPRNAVVGHNSYSLLTGFAPTGPWDLVCGRGVQQVAPGSGTITASGSAGSGSNPAALFNLQVNLFFPAYLVPDPVVKYDGLWWPAMSISCSVTNTVELDSGGELEMSFDCTTLPDPESTTEISAFSFFGVSVPVFCMPLAPASGPDPAETRTFSGSLTVADEWS